MICRTDWLILEERNWPAVCGHQNVQPSVVVNVCVCNGTSHARSGERRARSFRNFRKFSFAQIPEQMRRLGEFHVRLDFLNVRIDVAIHDENVLPAVEIVVEEKAAKTERKQGS